MRTLRPRIRTVPVAPRHIARPEDQATRTDDVVQLGRYTASICDGLMGMADRAGESLLSYFLSMAKMEAERLGRTEVPPV